MSDGRGDRTLAGGLVPVHAEDAAGGGRERGSRRARSSRKRQGDRQRNVGVRAKMSTLSLSLALPRCAALLSLSSHYLCHRRRRLCSCGSPSVRPSDRRPATVVSVPHVPEPLGPLARSSAGGSVVSPVLRCPGADLPGCAPRCCLGALTGEIVLLRWRAGQAAGPFLPTLPSPAWPPSSSRMRIDGADRLQRRRVLISPLLSSVSQSPSAVSSDDFSIAEQCSSQKTTMMLQL